MPYDDEEVLQYIAAVENPTKEGWDENKKRWSTPKKKGFDRNQIGYGLDIREENNPIVYNFLKSNNRLANPWLTELEEHDLRMQTWGLKKHTVDSLATNYGKSLSQMGYNRLAGMTWHGHPALMLKTPESITNKAFLKAIEDKDDDLNGVFDAYYNYGTNATRYANRIILDASFYNDYRKAQQEAQSEQLRSLVQDAYRPRALQPVSTAVHQTIPEEQVRHTYDDARASSYVTGKPMFALLPRVNIPTAAEVAQLTEWLPKGFKNGKQPDSSLPYPLRSSRDYNDDLAYRSGIVRDPKTGHMWSTTQEDYPAERTYLKTPFHPTHSLAVWGDKAAGYDVYYRNGLEYSSPDFGSRMYLKPPFLFK